MTSLIDKIEWTSLAYTRASRLPDVLRRIEVTPRWHPGTPGDVEFAWEEVRCATFESGIVSDAAYAVLDPGHSVPDPVWPPTIRLDLDK